MKNIYLVQTLDTEDSYVTDPIPFTDIETLNKYLSTEYPEHVYVGYASHYGRSVYRYSNDPARIDVLVFTIGTYQSEAL